MIYLNNLRYHRGSETIKHWSEPWGSFCFQTIQNIEKIISLSLNTCRSHVRQAFFLIIDPKFKEIRRGPDYVLIPTKIYKMPSFTCLQLKLMFKKLKRRAKNIADRMVTEKIQYISMTREKLPAIYSHI